MNEPAKIIGEPAEAEAGFSMLELMLALMASGILILAVFRFTQDWQESTVNHIVADHLITVHEAAEAYVSANFMELWVDTFGESIADTNSDGIYDNSDLVSIGDHIQIPLDSAGWTTFYLKDETGVLSPSFPDRNALNHQLSVYVLNAGIIGGKRTLEVITKSWALASDPDASPASDKRIREIASIIGTKGGYISAVEEETGTVLVNVCSNPASDITGIFGTWQIPVTDLQSPVAGSPFCQSVAPQAGLGGYPIAYSRITFDELNDKYLYRIAIPGRPELNRMRTNIDMGGRSFTGANALIADYARVENTLRVYGGNFVVDEIAQIYGNSSALVESITTVDPANLIYDVDGNVIGSRCYYTDPLSYDHADKNEIDPLAVGSPGCKVVPGRGDLIVKGRGLPAGAAALTVEELYAPEATIFAETNNSSGPLNISGDLNISGTASANELNTGDMTASNTDVLFSGTLNQFDINGSVPTTIQINADNVTTSSLAVSGSLDATNVNTDNLTSTGTTTISGSMDATNLSADNITSCTAIVQSDGTGGFIIVPDYNCSP